MKKIMFNDKYQLTKAVLEGRKTMTRREPVYSRIGNPRVENVARVGRIALFDGSRLVHESRYALDETVAIAQSYSKVYAEKIIDFSKHNYHLAREDAAEKFKKQYEKRAAWNNKMYVKPDLMPHRIRITDVKVERLQDISWEDCLLEGIEHDVADGAGLWWWDMEDMKLQNELLRHEWNGKQGLWFWDTPQGAFASLINKINGKGTWNTNPFVFAYTFKLED